MKKILVINFRYFGDALISASLSVRIRELWPDAHITYLVFDSVEGVLEGIETIDEILTVPERPGKWEQFRWMVAHWNNYDLAFVTQTGTRPGLYGFFMAQERIGFTPGFSKRNWWKKMLLTKHVQEVPGPKILQLDSLLTATGAEPAKAPYVRNRMRSCPQRLVLTCRTSCCIPCRDMPTRLGLRIIGVLLSGV